MCIRDRCIIILAWSTKGENMNKVRVLMIDDNIDLVSMLKEYFKDHASIEVVLEANDGERGLELIKMCIRDRN